MKTFILVFCLCQFMIFRLQAKRYFENKCFNMDFGDLLSLLRANMLNLQIIITYTPKLQLRDRHVVSP